LTYKNGVDFQLKYQYSAIEKNPNASLIIYDEKKFIKQLPLFPISTKSSFEFLNSMFGKNTNLPKTIDNYTYYGQTSFTTPVNTQANNVQLRNYFNYDTQPILKYDATSVKSNLFKQSIDPNSTVDILSYPTYKDAQFIGFQPKGFHSP
jgi:hypothetical protein